ncbi:MAG: TIGR04100 family radical SAM protein [Cellulosilyticaceae bacterium]
MTILYEIQNSLYINLTNKCSCACTFCVRQKADGVHNSESLWLKQDVTLEAAIEALEQKDLECYESIVFCGYGEPLIKLDEVIGICQYIKQKSQTPIRINTNGLAGLTHKRDVPALLKGYVESISISLNAPDAVTYNRICRPVYGEGAYDSLLEFVRSCKQNIPQVILSVVEGTISPEQIKGCQQVADELMVPLRVREAI